MWISGWNELTVNSLQFTVIKTMKLQGQRVICAILILFVSISLYAQEVTIGVTKHGLTKIKIAIDSNLPRELTNTLFSDLVLCDYFEPLKTRSGARLLLEVRQTGGLIIEAKVYDLEKNQMLFGKKFSGTEKQGRKLVHALSNYLVSCVTGEKGIAETRLTFEHNGDIYVSDYDGANLFRITKGNLNLFPNWSSNGDKLVYTSYLYGQPQIFVYDLLQSKQYRVSGFPGLNSSAVFSPDDKKIALTLSKDGNPEIYIMSLSGTDTRRITNNRSVDTSPSFSPDGKKIAFVSNQSGTPQIYIADISGAGIKRITFTGAYNTNPCWSPKGNLIVYNSIGTGNKFQIFTIDVKTGETAQITSSDGSCENPSFAPDGRHIVFSYEKGYNKHLCIMDIFYKEIHKLNIGTGVNGSNPDWSR